MKAAWLKDLQSQLDGSVTDAADALEYFATDGGIFTIRPSAVIYPQNTHDVQRAVSYLHRLAEQGEKVSLVARGKGTDQGGGAVGEGVMMVFIAHMNKLLRLGKDRATFQPGLIFGDLQNTLHTHGRFLPPYPSSVAYSSLGGAVANNACGEKTVKYGATRDYVENLKVVLSNGDLIETRRISEQELDRKKGQADFEGDIYRQLDTLILDNAELIKNAPPDVSKNSAGYALWNVRQPDGSFDLSQIIVGSQGTLGVVTEATLRTVAYNPKTTLLVGYFDALEKVGEAVQKLMPLGPSALEVVDYYLLDILQQEKPGQLEGLVPDPLPKVVLLIEFDDRSRVAQTYKAKRAEAILKKFAASQKLTADPKEQANLWRIRHSAADVIMLTRGTKKALPFIEDTVVPVEKLPEYLKAVYKLMNKYKLTFAVWGHAGNANFHMQPFMDLGKAADRNKVFAISDELYGMVIKMGGSTCGEHNDGLSRSPYLRKLYGDDVYKLFQAVKRIFDPLGVLNPMKKADNVTVEYTKPLLRHEYVIKHHDHLPHS